MEQGDVRDRGLAESPPITVVVGRLRHVTVDRALRLLGIGGAQLAVVDAEPMPLQGFPNIPPITKDYPEFGKYLPWGPFYGVFVKRDEADTAKAKLVAAFKTAASNPKFVELMEGLDFQDFKKIDTQRVRELPGWMRS